MDLIKRLVYTVVLSIALFLSFWAGAFTKIMIGEYESYNLPSSSLDGYSIFVDCRDSTSPHITISDPKKLNGNPFLGRGMHEELFVELSCEDIQSSKQMLSRTTPYLNSIINFGTDAYVNHYIYSVGSWLAGILVLIGFAVMGHKVASLIAFGRENL